MKHASFFHLILLALCILAGPLQAQSVFQMPEIFPFHRARLNEFMQSMAAKNYAAAETAARAGSIRLPNDSNWAYNVACTLALQGKTEEALDQLEKAIRLGLHNAEQIENDSDLKALHLFPRFRELLELAKSLVGTPPANLTLMGAAPIPVETGTELLVTEANTNWDWNPQTGGYLVTMLRFTPGSFDKDAYTGPGADVIRPWLKDGTAAGNTHDLYVNRDADSLSPEVKDFPGLTPVFYDDNAQKFNAHLGGANGVFRDENTRPVSLVGSSSFAFSQATPFFRSIPRLMMLDSPVPFFQYALANQFYVYTSASDFNPKGLGDLFPSNTPYALIVSGEHTDVKPFTEAALAALAAMQPKTKNELIRRGLTVPTLQMLFRLTQKPVDGKIENYLNESAHPAAFPLENLDIEALVKKAHALEREDIQPVLQLRMIRYSMPKPSVDFFDVAQNEGIADTPCSITRVIRGMDYTRQFTVEAFRPPLGMKLHWLVVNGDPEKIRITPRTDSGSIVDVEVDYHGLYTGSANGIPMPMRRVDLAVVGVSGDWATVPSFISLRYLANEKRVYNDKKLIESVDYRITDSVYSDPRLTARKAWKDTYLYSAKDQCIGWMRELPGSEPQRFTSQGYLVKTFDDKGRPLKAVNVIYQPRRQEGVIHPIDLTQTEGTTEFTYSYASDDDFIGTPR